VTASVLGAPAGRLLPVGTGADGVPHSPGVGLQGLWVPVRGPQVLVLDAAHPAAGSVLADPATRAGGEITTVTGTAAVLRYAPGAATPVTGGALADRLEAVTAPLAVLVTAPDGTLHLAEALLLTP
jgi:hypothetical protein